LVVAFLLSVIVAAACTPAGGDQANSTALEATISHLEAQLTPRASISAVIITVPTIGQRFQTGQTVEVQYEAIGKQGISRVELLVDGDIVTADDFIPQPGSPFVAKSLWVPDRPGSYSLQIQAFSPDNVVIQSGPVFIEVEAVVPIVQTEPTRLTPSPTRPTVRSTNTPMTIPLPPTATVVPSPTVPPGTPTPDYPHLIARVEPGLNVREGPSTTFRRLGSLRPGETARIFGQNDIGAGKWWQIEFSRTPGGVGWVSARADLVEAVNATDVAIAAVPSPEPALATPTPVPTPVPPPVQTDIEFSVDRAQINAGECVTVYWNVTDVKEVYYRGQGVPGTNQGRRECPTLTESYELRVVRNDNQVESRIVRVEVAGTSFKTAEIDANEGIDFDEDGKVSSKGDDFKWVIEDGARRFKKWDNDGDLRLVAIGPLEMEMIAEEDCRYALANINDRERVKPFPGMAACFKTDEGRMGKVRFDDVDDDADIQWALW
jgi:hypothetical protein